MLKTGRIVAMKHNIIINSRLVSDKTFATRFKSFLKDVQVNCFAGQEELEYMKYVADKLLRHQIATATNKLEIEYLDQCHNKIIVYKIAEEFSKTPGARYKHESDFSGEELREILVRKISDVILLDKKLLIDLDGVAGYGSAFIDEVFRELKNAFPNIESKIILKSDEEPYLIDDIKEVL